MTYYVVTREGVYRHEIKGVFSSREDAIDAATKCALQECDGYHSFDISEVFVNSVVDDVETVYTVTRSDYAYERDVEGVSRRVIHNPPLITLEKVK